MKKSTFLGLFVVVFFAVKAQDNAATLAKKLANPISDAYFSAISEQYRLWNWRMEGNPQHA